MRFHLAPRPLLHLITAILLSPPALANPAPPISAQAGFSFNELFARYECGGELCGYSSQLCCSAGSSCYTDAADQAQCGAANYATTSAAVSGSWQYYTSTYVETDLVTKTKVYSSWIAGASSAATTWATASPTAASCNYASYESSCGSICCASGQYCYVPGQCKDSADGTSAATSDGATAVAPIRGTSSALTVVTETASPSTTVPFQTPVATGANITLTSNQQSGGGLSGGAIAGIVIGVLVGLFLLGLLCFYCCLRGLWAACFGRNKKRRRTTEVEEYERRSHHAHGRGSSNRGGGRTWYGAAKPARSRYSDRSDRDRRDGGGGWKKEALGLGAGLAGLWALLGLKRKRDNRKNEEKHSEYSYSSDYYTSASKSTGIPPHAAVAKPKQLHD
ncbi:hypothetical protein B0A50_06053 [Salinomyces thailandicus]|uniref:Mid2 domain-containing protein n=1 Tax=Salinomyces thailandicus TaxID=706561 RepID=A0A4U0TT15_9PEZI|nr:hypothetical protein B0A50_06053 [Salinomyces thailandica]